MRSILLVCWANLRKKKGQSLLVLLILLASSLAFATSLGVLGAMHAPYERMHAQLGASHLLLLFDNRAHDAQEVFAWWQKQESIVSLTRPMPFVQIMEKTLHGERELEHLLFLTERSVNPAEAEPLLIVEGNDKDYPGFGELWITTAMAYASNINVGDTLSVPTVSGRQNMIVSAIVVDPQYSSGLTNPVRAWAAPGELSFLFPLGNLNDVMLGMRLADGEISPSLWSAFEDFLGTPFSGIRMDHALLKGAYSLLFNLIGVITLIFSLILILVALFIISATINSAVLADYRVIGTLKAQGFCPGNIASIYVAQFLCLGLIAVPAGALLSNLVTRQILASLVRSLGVVNTELSLFGSMLTTIACLLALIAASSALAARKAGLVKPADAIRYGAPPERHRKGATIRLTAMRRLTLPVALGIKQIFTSRRQAIVSLLSLAITAFVLVFSVNVYHSLLASGEKLAYWGFDDSHVLVRRAASSDAVSRAELERFLADHPQVKQFLAYDWVNNSVLIAPDGTTQNIIGKAYAGDMEAAGMMNLQGRHPLRSDEISLAIGTSRQTGKQVGDSIELFIEGRQVSFTVTGIYQAMDNMGQGFRLTTAAMEGLNPLFEPTFTTVALHDDNQSEVFVRETVRRFGNQVDVTLTRDQGDTMQSIVGNMGLAVAFISLVFLAVAFTTFFNSTLISIQEQQKSLGVYKTLGLTPEQIRLSLVCRSLVLAAAGLLVALPLGLLLTPRIMSLLLVNIGIVSFPFSIHWLGTSLLIPLCLLVSAASVWLPSVQILKINPRQLITE